MSEAKESFLQEISTRETAVKNAETEIEELRKVNKEFPEKLEKTLSDQKQIITESLQTRYDFDMQLTTSKNQAEVRLKDQMIKSLQEKIQELQSQLKEFADKATIAESGVKEIAMKAIENSSKVRIYPAKSEKEDN